MLNTSKMSRLERQENSSKLLVSRPDDETGPVIDL